MVMQRPILMFLGVACSLGILAGCRESFEKRKQKNESQVETSGQPFSLSESSEAGEDISGQELGPSRGDRIPGRGRLRARHRPLSLSPAEVQSFGIETQKVSYRQVQSLHLAMGKVLAPPTRMAKVSYAFPARISGIHINIGDWVEKGQRVLSLQSEEVGRAKSEYYKAVADLTLAKSSFEREKRLFDRGVGAQKNTLATEAEYKVAQANLDAAEKKLHVLGFSEEDVKVIAQTHQINPEISLFAPIRGKVIEHHAVLGGMIDQSSELITIMDPTVLWVDAEIFESDIAKIHIGQRVRITLPAYPGDSFKGELNYISEILNEESRTITVRTEVQNREFKLKAGMFANVAIYLNSPQMLLAVPADAVLDDENDRIVFVKSGDLYFLRAVSVGHAQNGFCTIADGLQSGEIIVTKGNYMLKSKLYDEALKKSGVH
jgi:cobalt-zinc-cadmium efflux system membrane fusion protein